jgi:hypothetical protein
MRHFSEYHSAMRTIGPSVVFVAMVAAFGFFSTASQAQVNGVPSSVTSPGFGGHPVNGTPPSVTSVGPRGFGPHSQVTLTAPAHVPHSGNGQKRHHRQGDSSAPLLYAYPYPVPYGVDNSAEDSPEPGEADSNEQGGPTVFDRRGSGARSYVPPVKDARSPHAADRTDDAQSDPQADADPTLLVFKDGRKMEVGNYAIVGTTLFDLTPGHPRKIAIADLDLEATRQQNDERGMVFQLPPSLRMN